MPKHITINVDGLPDESPNFRLDLSGALQKVDVRYSVGHKHRIIDNTSFSLFKTGLSEFLTYIRDTITDIVEDHFLEEDRAHATFEALEDNQ